MAPRPAVRRRLAVLAAALASAGVGGAVDVELQGKLAELETLLRSQTELIQSQQRQLSSQQDRLDVLVSEASTGGPVGRRLQAALPPSIHGAYDDAHRAYTFEESMAAALDSVWKVICGSLVLFMQAGFAMREAGLVRASSAPNVMMKHLTHICVGTIGWFLVGWALAYGGPYTSTGLKDTFIGSEGWVGLDTRLGEGPRYEPSDFFQNWFFSWSQCCVVAAIVSGGVAERMNFISYSFFSFYTISVIYSIIIAFTWGGGWIRDLNSTSFHDFAGSGLIHVCGGTAALIGAVMAKPRKERFEFPERYAPSNLALVVLGTFILWFGWYGMNCGMVQMASNASGMAAALVAMNTTISASASGLVVFILRRVIISRFCIQSFCNGILAGLVAISAGCASVTPWSAFLIGAVGGALYLGTSLLLRKLRVDDPVDAFAVHGAAGAWGVLAAAIFNMYMTFAEVTVPDSFDCARNVDGQCITDAWTEMIVANLVEVGFVFVWAGLCSIVVFAPLRLMKCLKIQEEYEESSGTPPTSGGDVESSALQPAVGGLKPTLHFI